MSWVRPLRISTPEGDTIHGAEWPDGRIFAWEKHGPAEAWMTPEVFETELAERGWTVEWADAP